jgi:Astacin (Peptidase family M12A)
MAAKAKGESKRADAAAGDGAEVEPRLLCSQKTPAVHAFEGVVTGPRLEAILSNSRQWANGTRLHVYYYRDAAHGRLAGRPEDIEVMRRAFGEWKALGIGLEFEEVDDIARAELRVAFQAGDGSWSYVGRDSLRFPSPGTPTMNLGWPLTTPFGHDTALHEIGHALGMNHEHQNPRAGIVWNEEAVIRTFSGPPNNWDLAKIRNNILAKLDPNEVTGSVWDRDSIMHYEFAAGVILLPEKYRTRPLIPAPGFSSNDREWAAKYYPALVQEPPVLTVAQSRLVHAGHPGQADFVFVPEETRTYTISLFGLCDCVLLVTERTPDGDAYLAGEDDTGRPDAATLRVRLTADRRYAIKVKVHWRPEGTALALMAW